MLIEQSSTVAQCLSAITLHANLLGGWHLRKTNWCGEAAEVLEDEDKPLNEAGVSDGGYLLVEEGRLPPKGFVRLEIFHLTPFPEGAGPDNESRAHQLSELNSNIDSYLAKNCKEGKSPALKESEVKKEEIHPENVSLHPGDTATHKENTNFVPKEGDLIKVYPPVQMDIRFLDQIDISQTDTINDLKLQLLTLDRMSDTVPVPSCLRVQEIVEGRPQKVFKDGQHTLKRCKVVSGSRLGVLAMHQEQIFPNSCLLLKLSLHVYTGEPGGQFLPPEEIVFDTTESSTPTALLHCISSHSNIPLQYLRAAKYRMDRFEWVRIQEPPGTPRKKQRKNKTPPPKPSVRNAPLSLKDNDMIGIKDIRHEGEETVNEWYMEWDHVGLKLLTAIKEEKRRKRSTKGKDVLAIGGGGSRSKRPEIIPVIKFGDFFNFEPMETVSNGIDVLEGTFISNN